MLVIPSPQGPETIRESHFATTYGHDLMEARACCRRYRERGDVNDLNQAWDLYYQVSDTLIP